MIAYLWVALVILMVAKYPLIMTGRFRLAAYTMFSQAGVIGLVIIQAHKQAVATGVAEPFVMYALLGILAVACFIGGRTLLVKADQSSKAPKS